MNFGGNRIRSTHLRDVCLQVLDFLDDIDELSIHGHGRLIQLRNVTSRAAKFDWEWRTVQCSELSDLVSRVDDHLGTLDEGKAEDGIHCDMGSSGDEERTLVTVRCLVRQMEEEGDVELRGDGLASTLNDS